MSIKYTVDENGGVIDEDGCHWNSISDYIVMGVLPLCGCGDNRSIAIWIKDMFLKHVVQTNSDDTSCWNSVHHEDLPLMFFLSWATDKGYIEHGSTIRCSWMTTEGDELLKYLQNLEIEESEE